MSDVDDDAGDWSDCEGDEELLDDDPYAGEDIVDEDPDYLDCEDDFDSPHIASHSEQQVLSLKENCLKSVVNNFERFHQAFVSSEDPALQLNLKFLQRVYTPDIIEKLYRRGRLKENYLDFLINESLKELDIGSFIASRCSLKAIKDRISHVGHCLEKVLLKITNSMNENVMEFLSETLRFLPNVEAIDIPCNCNDTVLKNISIFCTKLKELYIDFSSDVSEIGLESLCKERDTECLIQILSIKLIRVSDETIKVLLKNLPYLEVLEYTHLPSILYSIHEEDLKNNKLETAKKYNLTKLDFSCSYDTKLENFLRVWTVVCPKVKTVNLHVSSPKELDLISRFSNLENLTIATTNSSRETHMDINNFLKLIGSRLKKIKIGRMSCSVSNLIESCLKLNNLTLSFVQFQKHIPQSSSHSKLSNLLALSIEGTSFAEQYAEDSITDLLLNSPNLEELSFKECLFRFENSEINTKLAKYCENCVLQTLTFNDCNIELALLESIILTCPSLTHLKLESCENISYDDVEELQRLINTANGHIKIEFQERDSDGSDGYADYFDDYDDDYDNYSDDYDIDDYDGYDAFDDHILWFA